MSAKHTPGPTPGHKFGKFSVSTHCECGWKSAGYFGKGARSGAMDEWRGHKVRCAS